MAPEQIVNKQMLKRVAGIAGLALIMSAGVSSDLWACSLASTYETMEIMAGEPEEATEFPPPVVLELGSLTRAESPNSRMQTSCSDLGMLAIEIAGYDDRYGLIFEFDGEFPENFRPPQEALRFEEQATLEIHWGDQESRGEAIDMSVVARWVDQYGELGPMSDPLVITDGGSSGCGCSATDGGADEGSMALLGLLVVGMILRRRHRREGRA